MRSLAHGFYRVTFHTALQYQVSVVSFMAFNFDIVPFLHIFPLYPFSPYFILRCRI